MRDSPVDRFAVLVVDDDALVLRAVERTMQPEFSITTATNMRHAIETLAGKKTFAVIVSDLRMPGGGGIELLQYARTKYPNMVRVMFSGAAQLRDAMAAVNDGEVFRLLTKPFNLVAMRQALNAASEQHRLIMAERVLLEETLNGSIKALTDIRALVQPMAFGRGMRLQQYATALAQRIGMDHKWDVEIAALISQIGCVTMDAGTLDRWYHNHELTPEERVQVDRLPHFAEALIADIPRLETVRAILRQQYDPFTSALPVGAAILAIVRDYDTLVTDGQTSDEALATMDSRGERYGTALMNHFRAIHSSAVSGDMVTEMPLSQVKDMMTFSADVYAPNGLLLIARGQRVTPALVSRLRADSFGLERSTMVRMVVSSAS